MFLKKSPSTISLPSPSMIESPSISVASSNEKLKTKKKSILLLTCISTSLFLIILCICILGALVLVGRNLLDDSALSSRLARNIQLSNDNLNNLDNDLVINSDPQYYMLDGKKVSVVNKFKIGQTPKSEVKFTIVDIAPTIQTSENLMNKNLLTKTMSKVIDKLTYRLPNEIVPKKYKLFLHPNLNNEIFNGHVTIELKILKPIQFIAVHTKYLNITETKLSRTGSKKNETISIKNTFEYLPYEYWITELEKDLDAGEYSLDLQFNGNLANRIVGFYQSKYLDKSRNETRKIVSSKFEPTYARQAFPCFDEPAMKAEFEISLVRPKDDNYKALSNMNEVSSEPFPNNESLVIIKFDKSPKMSTYLACFIVADFDFKEYGVNANGIGKDFKIKVYATPANKDKVEFAGNTGARVIEYYLDYFKIPYPLPKLDMAAIPDFVSGAMETWGLVTYRETALLYDKDESSTVNKQRVAIVVAHELAHMWFGNLVTMKWWNELWLNEGFATFILYKGVEHLYPEFGIMDQFLIREMQSVLTLDATISSHPIVQSVENPDQITEIFDSITYEKGASIIRMIEHFVTPDIFQKSVKNYLEAHHLSSAETNDLLEEITKLLESDVDITHVVNTWIRQKGYPYVTLERIDGGKKYKLEQQRFLIDPDSKDNETDTSEYNWRWDIPITYITDKDKTSKTKLFKQSDSSEDIEVPEDHTWIKLNKNQIGYYRVLYPEDMWKKLTEALIKKHDDFSVADRANLIDDVFSFSEAQHIKYDIALELTQYLLEENDYVPWDVASAKFKKISRLIMFTNVYEKFMKNGQDLVNTTYETIGWEAGDDGTNEEDGKPEDNHLTKLARTTVLEFACLMGHDGCLNEAHKRFETWISDPSKKIDPDIRTIVYYYGLATTGSEKYWDIMWNLYETESDAQEKMKLMYGLSAIRDPLVLNKYLYYAKNKVDVIRGQDYFTCLNYIAANPVGEPIVWDFVRNNWKYLVDRFTLNDRYLGQMVHSITSKFSTPIKLAEMEDFFRNNPDAGAGTASRAQALENVRNNIKWLDNNLESISNWLEKSNL